MQQCSMIPVKAGVLWRYDMVPLWFLCVGILSYLCPLIEYLDLRCCALGF